MTETQRKVFDAFTASAKAWFEMEAERLEWTTMRNISNLCKTYLASFVEDVEDGITCVDNRLVLELGVFHDCSRTPTTPCDGCSEVESIFYCISTDSDSNDLLQEWEALFNNDPSPFMPDCFKWEGDNIDPDVEENEEDTDNHYDPWDDPEGNYDFADPGGTSALRRATASNPRNQPCGQCGRENVLTPKDKHIGYVCDICADSNERGGP